MAWLLVPVGVVAVLLAVIGARFARLRMLRKRDRQRRAEFQIQRERLEAKFFELAGNSGKPRGLRWTDCSFDDEVTYARQRENGELCALVSVTISFEAIIGGGMEEVEAVGNLRSATAVFRVVDGRWQTDGRAIFNLNPTEAIAYYQENLSPIGPSGA
ncbi:MAG TPA: hypothetical protein VGJ26_19395 [Pirellulales bacterium]|jgi:hypothetical protein